MTALEIKGIILFMSAFFNFFLSWLVWHKSRGDKTRLHLGFMAFFSASYALVFGIVYFFWGFFSPDLLLFFIRATWIGVLILSAFVVFIYYFTGKIKYIKIKSFLLYAISIIIAGLAAFTPLFIGNVFQKGSFILAGKLGPLQSFGRIFIISCLVLGLVNLSRYYFKAEGFKKLQTKYFILGLSIYVAGGIIATGLMPLLFSTTRYVEVPIYLSLIWITLTAYAILKHRLMDIRMIMGKISIYLLCAFTVSLMAFLILFLNNQLSSPLSPNLIWFAMLITVVFTFHSLSRFFESIAGKYFYYTQYSLRQMLKRLSGQLNQTIELDKLAILINSSLLDALQLERVGLILKEPKEKTLSVQSVINFEEKDLFSWLIKKDNFLTEYLNQSKQPIVREEIPFIAEKTGEQIKNLRLLKQDMDALQIGLFLPLFIGEKLMGILVLGNKLSREAYTVQDLELLTTLSVQTATVLNNALSYAELGKRKAYLENFYKLTLGRELKMAALKKKIERLEKKKK